MRKRVLFSCRLVYCKKNIFVKFLWIKLAKCNENIEAYCKSRKDNYMYKPTKFVAAGGPNVENS